MESYDVLGNLLQWYAAVFCGSCFAWYAASLLRLRFRSGGWVVAAAYAGCRLLVSLFREEDAASAASAVRLMLMLAAGLALCFLCCRQRGLLLVYVCVSWEAIFELAFFISYTVIFAGDPIYAVLTDQITANPSRDPQQYLNRILETAYAFQILMSVVLSALCILSCRSIVGSFPRERARLTPPEFRLLILPAVGGFLMSILLRMLMIVVTDNVPVLLYDRYAPLRFVVPGIALVMGAAIIYSVQTFRQMVDLEAEQRARTVVEGQLSSLRFLMQDSERTNERVARLRHDLRNTLTVIQALSEDIPEGEALSAYLADLNGEMQAFDRPFHTGDPVADTLLAIKHDELRRLDPDAAFDAADFVLPNGTSISGYDLGVILGNALDNALRAVAEQKTQPRFVRLRAFRHEDLLCLIIENSTDAKAADGGSLPASTKEEEGHGIGMSSIRAIAARYDGTMDWKLDGGVFRLSVMMQDRKQT
ncbi:MAG: GHKL domain-containing protein [Clostridia bacterium]|nr:GHKL domain-containing protein [Clostridia bacterium]